MGYTKPEKMDILTKAFGRDRFQKLRDKVGIVNIQPVRQG
jgi:hypothetical protein